MRTVIYTFWMFAATMLICSVVEAGQDSVDNSRNLDSEGAQCPPEGLFSARKTLAHYIFSTDPDWSEFIKKIQLDKVESESEIQPLEDPDDTGICRQLNQINADRILKKIHLDYETVSGNKTYYYYDYVYYKVADRYIAYFRPSDRPKSYDNQGREMQMTTNDAGLILYYDKDINIIASHPPGGVFVPVLDINEDE